MDYDTRRVHFYWILIIREDSTEKLIVAILIIENDQVRGNLFILNIMKNTKKDGPIREGWAILHRYIEFIFDIISRDGP